jgi:uncharacterized protein YggU (UPF0235/DUF167 family)
VPSSVFRPVRGGIALFVRLTPHALKDEIGNIEMTADGREHLAARVRAIPDKGKANAALEKLVAAWLGVPRTTVTVSAGFTQRLKSLRIDGETAELAAHVEMLVRGLGNGKDSG